MKPAKQVSGKWLLLLSGLAVVAALAFVGYAFTLLSPNTGGTLYGTLFVNEAGMADVTTGMTASYNATLTVQKGNGTILFTFVSGSRDLIQNHLLSISNYSVTPDRISMSINGHTVSLPWQENDTVWNHQYDHSYIGSSGPHAPSGQVRGQIDPAVFGLPPQYYVEFRFAALGGKATPQF